ncbi:adenosylmethionine decarboxylase [Aureivirga sp. CE67]|uniref:adenosylmethionine decarboxylase n=1 Tax=Aureivirga sp. CE67 TaxID=1788983 RepID=UPI0018C9665B|nr:adenosylmethionine decarboxylase [Aureivirga sp. CE67]
MHKYLGFETAIEFYGCDSELIDNRDFIEEILLKTAEILNLTVVNTTIHKFSPIGVSGVIVIAESHIAVHTWPEHGYVAIDFFTCNQTYNYEEGISYLKEVLQASFFEKKEIRRGDLETIKKHLPILK